MRWRQAVELHDYPARQVLLAPRYRWETETHKGESDVAQKPWHWGLAQVCPTPKPKLSPLRAAATPVCLLRASAGWGMDPRTVEFPRSLSSDRQPGGCASKMVMLWVLWGCSFMATSLFFLQTRSLRSLSSLLPRSRSSEEL